MVAQGLVRFNVKPRLHQGNMLQIVASLLLDTKGYMLPWCKRGFRFILASNGQENAVEAPRSCIRRQQTCFRCRMTSRPRRHADVGIWLHGRWWDLGGDCGGGEWLYDGDEGDNLATASNTFTASIVSAASSYTHIHNYVSISSIVINIVYALYYSSQRKCERTCTHNYVQCINTCDVANTLEIIN